MPENASRDANYVPTLLAVSSVDGRTPVKLYADPTTHRLLTGGSTTSGDVAPSTTPASIGLMYIDTVTNKVYVSTGTASSADWTILN